MQKLFTTQVEESEDVINFGIGQPAMAILPLDIMREAAVHRLSQGEPELLNYGAEAGGGYFRLVLAEFLSQGYKEPVAADSLFVTTGSSRALDFLCAIFTQANDTIFVEEPSYFLALDIFKSFRLNIVGIPIDEQGLIIEALEEKLTQYKPIFLYTIPSYQNPTSVTLPQERREKVAVLSQRHNFIVVADEVYQLLNYTAEPPPPMASYAAEAPILSVGSFSKILGPGLRLGWIQSNPKLLEPFINSGVVVSGGGLNPFTSELVRSVIETGEQQRYLDFLKTHYRQCIEVMDEALHVHLPSSITYKRPDGGFFFWLELPAEVDAAELLTAAQPHKVGFHPGIKFSSQDGLRNMIRLSFAFYDGDQIREGVRRLGAAVRQFGL